MNKLFYKSVILTILIVAPLIIITNSLTSQKNINPEIKLLIWIVAGVLSVAAILIIGNQYGIKKKKPSDKSQTGKAK